MEKDLSKMLMKLSNEYLKEVYQMANEHYFISYVNDDKEGANYYKELFSAIGEELRKRNYWSY